jgi:hypothetical protein
MAGGKMTDLKATFNMTSSDKTLREELAKCLRVSPIPDNELCANLPLYEPAQEVQHRYFMRFLYRQIVGVTGSIMELGTRWGRHIVMHYQHKRIYEPFKWPRKLLAFDTFQGFASVHEKDKGAEKGGFSVVRNYEEILELYLKAHNRNSGVPLIRQHEIIKGDVEQTLPEYLKRHPETVIALCYFDFDVYRPTKFCLEVIQPYLTKGSIIAFDELNCEKWPGETEALRKVLGTNNVRLQQHPIYSIAESYFVWE